MGGSSSQSRQSVREHCREIDRCNQRGGRMLSVVDLIDAGTIPVDLAAYFAAAIGKSTSFMVGANPGGAGKTTVMGALLNLVPDDVHLLPADSERTVRTVAGRPSPRCCCICHEIGAGHYYAYLWGRVLVDLFRLPEQGHMVATNLHADTLDEARHQLCSDNPVPDNLFDRFGLMVFLDVCGRWGSVTRQTATVWEPDPDGPPRLVYEGTGNGGVEPVAPSRLVTDDEREQARGMIEALLDTDQRTIDEVRAFISEDRS